MQTFSEIAKARLGIMTFYRDHSAALPEHLAERFTELATNPGPVDQIVGTGEFIYANRDQLPKEALDLGAALISFAAVNMWHDLAVDARGDRMVAVLRHDIGELKTKPSGEAPEPLGGRRIDPPAAASE